MTTRSILAFAALLTLASHSVSAQSAADLHAPPTLLSSGTLASDFTAYDRDGKPVKLSDFRGRIVVLDFWATWCGVCLIALHHMAANAKHYTNKGVTVLAVNVWDRPGALSDWLPKHPEYNGLRFVVDPTVDRNKGIAGGLYGVSGLPTQYVIGKEGRIVKSIVGYDPGNKALKSALKAAGVE